MVVVYFVQLRIAHQRRRQRRDGAGEDDAEAQPARGPELQDGGDQRARGEHREEPVGMISNGTTRAGRAPRGCRSASRRRAARARPRPAAAPRAAARARTSAPRPLPRRPPPPAGTPTPAPARPERRECGEHGHECRHLRRGVRRERVTPGGTAPAPTTSCRGSSADAAGRR